VEQGLEREAHVPRARPPDEPRRDPLRKKYVPLTAYVAHGARISICNKDDFRHHPFSLGRHSRFGPVVLRPGECTTITALNPTEAIRQLHLYDEIHSQERMVILVAPARPKTSPATNPILWELKATQINPMRDPPRDGSVVNADSGRLFWKITDDPQVEFVVTYARRRVELVPGSRFGFPVTVTGRITGGTDTPGYRRIEPILYLNDRWVDTAAGVIQECGDPIGPEPILCSPPASTKSKLGFLVPMPRRRGDTFSYGVGALNCPSCYVRYVYVAR